MQTASEARRLVDLYIRPMYGTGFMVAEMIGAAKDAEGWTYAEVRFTDGDESGKAYVSDAGTVFTSVKPLVKAPLCP